MKKILILLSLMILFINNAPCQTKKHVAEPEMVFVQGGMFIMGCTSEQGSDCHGREMPIHQVTISDFYIGRYEVTQKQWREIMGTDIRQQCGDTSWPIKGEGDNYPMYYINWNDVQVFISRLNAKTGQNYRLPTEAEWEYASRGGIKSKGYKYSGSNAAVEVAWYDDNSDGTTHPVGTRHSNELGIYDMSGNVEEWCYDWMDIYSPYPQVNPMGISGGSHRVVRGGSMASSAYGGKLRVSCRSQNLPDSRNSSRGFRLVCSAK